MAMQWSVSAHEDSVSETLVWTESLHHEPLRGIAIPAMDISTPYILQYILYYVLYLFIDTLTCACACVRLCVRSCVRACACVLLTTGVCSR